MIEELFDKLYHTLTGKHPVSITKLPGSGSNRVYARITGEEKTVIGAWNPDMKENNAFVAFSEHFFQAGLPVPEVLCYQPDNFAYLLSDLGDNTLYQLLTDSRAGTNEVSTQIVAYYKQSLEWLAEFQIRGGAGIDYSLCYPRAAFDDQSVRWDLNYFKYYFLRLAKIPFDEQELENDFTSLCSLLSEADSNYFLYRDFQSRNIMIFNDKPWFIDYQGGRKGALQYDVASLLYDGKANLPDSLRAELLEFYLGNVSGKYRIDRAGFMKYYPAFILIRIIQALGAYGYRGYFEKKRHFLQSIPFALENLRRLRHQKEFGFGLNSLMRIIDSMVDRDASYYQSITGETSEKPQAAAIPVSDAAQVLTVRINSFSYKRALPADDSGNGGGFVFDCRALPNPGRIDFYKEKTGKDTEVIEYLKEFPEVASFLNNVYAIVDQSVANYRERGFKSLMVSFGCTGGRHRSVYCAENLAKHLGNFPGICIELTHVEQETAKVQ